MKALSNRIYVNTDYQGVNVGAVLTDRGSVCIDAPSYPRAARDWIARLQQLDPRPIRFLVLTDGHGDRILNSRWAGAPVVAHTGAAQKLASYDKRYPQSMLDSLIARNGNGGRELSAGPVEPAGISFSDKMALVEADVAIHLQHRPGPTPGSTWVYLPEDGILFTGDHVVAGWPPPLAEADIEGWLAALGYLQQSMSGVNCIVPGRGPIGDRQTVETVITFLEQVREQILEHLKAGRSREETAAYVPQFAAMFYDRFPGEWVRNQIRRGLERVYDQLRAAQMATPPVADTPAADAGS